MATDECGCVFGEGTLESPLVSCREPVGHRGEHRGRSLDGRYGARWPQAKQAAEREREWRYVMEGEKEAFNQVHAKLATAVEAFEAILGAESECGRYSGPQHLAEVAIDRTVLFLRTHGLLSDEKLAELERRGSIGLETRRALSEIEQGDARPKAGIPTSCDVQAARIDAAEIPEQGDAQ